MTYQEYVDSIKKSAVTTGKKVLIGELSKRLPWLFAPVIGPIATLLIGKLVEILVNETEFAVFFNYIDMRTDAQGRAFSEAAIENHRIQQTGTPDEKSKAEKILIARFKEFASLRG